MGDDGCVNLIVVIISHYTHISNHYPVHLVCVVYSVTQFLQLHGLYLPGFSVHGILQARIQGWLAISFSRGSS